MFDDDFIKVNYPSSNHNIDEILGKRKKKFN